jgi:lipoyl(octanoyl) transferase
MLFPGIVCELYKDLIIFTEFSRIFKILQAIICAMPDTTNSHTELGHNWRLIFSPPASGDMNMAADEALMESAVENMLTPTLRLFSWEPACLSLGYAQSYSEVDEASLQNHGWTLVRRPTGGRAILHTDEITYSITGRLDDPFFSGSILDSYRRLATGLVAALSNLGVQADMKELKDGSLQNSSSDAVCFEVASNYEITYEGKKLIGSAQSRRRGGFLQHGSLPLFGRLDRINDAILYNSESEKQDAKIRLLKHATTLESILGRVVLWQQSADAMVDGFRTALGIEFSEINLSDLELAKVGRLISEKYGNPDWNKRR